MAIEQLIKEIRFAWSGVPYPEDDDLTIHPLGLDEEFYEGLVGKAWHSLSSSFVNYHADCIGVLTPRGFRYFLPAFLISDLQLGGNTNIRSCLYWALQGCAGGDSSIKGVSGPDWFRSRIAELTLRQTECVIDFIDAVDDGGVDNYNLVQLKATCQK